MMMGIVQQAFKDSEREGEFQRRSALVRDSDLRKKYGVVEYLS
jgi:hypothetical protein